LKEFDALQNIKEELEKREEEYLSKNIISWLVL
jgi:hypothetical protein